MVGILDLVQLAQLALTNPDEAARVAAASGIEPPAEGSTLDTASPLIDQPLLPGESPLPVPGTASLPFPSPTIPPVPPTKPPVPTEPSTPDAAGAVLQRLFGPGSPFAGVSLDALQTPQNPVRQLGAPAVRGGSPGASQLQQILALLTGGQQPATQPSLGALIRGV